MCYLIFNQLKKLNFCNLSKIFIKLLQNKYIIKDNYRILQNEEY